MAALEQLVERAKWFHSIDFGGGLVSPGRFGADVPPNYTLYGVFEFLHGLGLEGAKVVDVGTMDGIVAFIAKQAGAKQVIATDMARRETFEAGRARLGLDIDYRVPVTALELPSMFAAEPADVLVMAGVLYHVLDPMAVMIACRQAVKRDGYAIVETMYLFDEGDARMSFSPADTTARGSDHANVFWRPSRRTLEGMFELAGFQVIGSIAVDGRIATLGRARPPVGARGARAAHRADPSLVQELRELPRGRRLRCARARCRGAVDGRVPRLHRLQAAVSGLASPAGAVAAHVESVGVARALSARRAECVVSRPRADRLDDREPARRSLVR